MRGLGMMLAVLLGLGAVPLPARADEAVTARVVLQSLPFGGVEVAAWTPDDKQIVSAVAAARTVLIWDVATGTIQDRLTLPSENAGGRIAERVLTGIEIADDGRTALIEGVSADETGAKAVLKPFAYVLDLTTHEIELVRGGDAKASVDDIDTVKAMSLALADYYEDVDGASEEAVKLRGEADAKLIPLPASHDGKRTLRRDPTGMAIEEAGQPTVLLKAQRPVRFLDAALSPDGSTLALAPRNPTMEADGKVSRIVFFDLAMGQYGLAAQLPGAFDHVEWVTPELLLAAQWTSPDDIGARVYTDPATDGAVLVDAATGTIAAKIPGRCGVTHLSDLVYFGAGLANCREGGSDRALQRYEIGGQWQPFGSLALPKGSLIELLAVSDTGKTLAVATRSADGLISLSLLDTETGELRRKRDLKTKGAKIKGAVSKLSMADDEHLLAAVGNQVGLWDLSDDSWFVLPVQTVTANITALDDDTVVIGGLGDDELHRLTVDDDDSYSVEGTDFPRVLAGDFIPETKLFWAMSADSMLRVWRTDDWSELFTTYLFEEDGFLTVAADGRYDTNVRPDKPQFRWVVSDEPRRSFAASTFMRQYYLPSLAPRLLECSINGDCEAKLGKPTPIAGLNRVVPEVTITNVEQAGSPDTALVSLEIREGFDPAAANGKARSGVYSPSIFRDGKLVASFPDKDFDVEVNPPTTLAEWQKANLIVDNDDQPGDGVWHLQATIFLPTAAGTETQTISAYAFNESRVKSGDAEVQYTRPPMAARQPRAYVVTAGVDAYDVDDLSLNYAASDARLINSAIPDIPGYEMRRLVIAGDRPAPGKTSQRVTAVALSSVLAVLGGLPHVDAIEFLKPEHIDARVLDKAMPDDLVILSFSGHGWADSQGNFFLLPTDAEWSDTTAAPVPESLVGAPELSMWLRTVDAGEIAFIIDACHSAAGVDAGKFRPGPMGDSGLGQLAYDKGIRILVATQAEDVALEDARLKHGLVSFALAGPGEVLSPGDLNKAADHNGEVLSPAEREEIADFNGDKMLSLEEWLIYPTWRLPGLVEEHKVGGLIDEQSDSAFSFPNRAPVTKQKVQEPTLFDYAGPSGIVLRSLGS